MFTGVPLHQFAVACPPGTPHALVLLVPVAAATAWPRSATGAASPGSLGSRAARLALPPQAWGRSRAIAWPASSCGIVPPLVVSPLPAFCDSTLVPVAHVAVPRHPAFPAAPAACAPNARSAPARPLLASGLCAVA